MRRLLILSIILTGVAPELLAADTPNVLVIVADDLGFSDLGCYGSEIETPHLDKLAAGGVRLARFYTTGRCCPSRASILTGLYPHRAGLGHMVKDLGQPGYRGRVSDRAVTLAQVVNTAGYRSFISGKWHLGGDDPTQHGFEEFYGTLVSAKTFWEPDHFLRRPANRERRAYDKETFYGTDAVTDHAISFLDLARKTPTKPWMLYLAYNAPHFPLQAPKEDIAKYADRYHVGWDEIREQRLKKMKSLGLVPKSTPLTPRSPFWNYGETATGLNPPWSTLPEVRRTDLARRMAIYAAMVDRLDQNIGRLLADLCSKDEFDNTLIIFLSDNGACAEWDPHGFDIKSSPNNILHRDDAIEHMGESGTFHSVGSGWANASNAPWRLYKHYNHEGGISSPCIVHWPAKVGRRGQIDHRPAHLIDLMPTLVEVSRATYPAELNARTITPMAGTSLLPLLQGEPVEARALYFEHEGNRAVIDGQWKLAALKNEPWELYDIDADRTELRDLAAEHLDIVKRLSVQWDGWAKENFVTPLPTDYGVEYLR
ncbi:MAG: arylsulfatase [Planctomycetes bacterium]|nr:arylsulfatase [Planctomycetota bacterium]